MRLHPSEGYKHIFLHKNESIYTICTIQLNFVEHFSESLKSKQNEETKLKITPLNCIFN